MKRKRDSRIGKPRGKPAAETKWEAINHLDKYLSEFADNLAKRGTKLFWASTAEDARNSGIHS